MKAIVGQNLCRECAGACCKYISIPLEEIAELDLRWLQARGTLSQTNDCRVFWRIPSRCPHLTTSGHCDIYATRPKSCKSYEVDGEMCRAVKAANTRITNSEQG